MLENVYSGMPMADIFGIAPVDAEEVEVISVFLGESAVTRTAMGEARLFFEEALVSMVLGPTQTQCHCDR